MDGSPNIQQNIPAASQCIYLSAKIRNARPNKFTQVAQFQTTL